MYLKYVLKHTGNEGKLKDDDGDPEAATCGELCAEVSCIQVLTGELLSQLCKSSRRLEIRVSFVGGTSELVGSGSLRIDGGYAETGTVFFNGTSLD